MAVLRVASRYRVLLVTFDLTRTVAGDRRYTEADQTLELYGQLFKPVKQLRLLTTHTSRRIKAALEQRIGRSASILIVPLTSVPAWRIHGHQKILEWRRFVRAVESRGIAINGLSSNAENAA